MKTWFTADTHFGHANILKYCNRPFRDIDHHDTELINRWNERVSPEDMVFHLGDFSLKDHNPYLSRLNGQKMLVLGNHDPQKLWKNSKLWAGVDRMVEVVVDDTKIVLCHYAMRVWHHIQRGTLHFYGHSHGNLQGCSQSCDVGVDCFDFRPVSLSEIKDRLRMQNKPHM